MTNGLTSAKLIGILCSVAAASRAAQPLIFPPRQEMTPSGSRFISSDQTTILIPAHETPGDLALARQLADELNDGFGAVVSVRRTGSASSTASVFVIGSIANPPVKAYCSEKHIAVTACDPGPSGYVLHAGGDLILIADSDDAGAFYGLQSLRQLIARTADGLGVARVRIRDWPSIPFRGIKLYSPGRDNIPFFIRHPELNAGWAQFARDSSFSRRNTPRAASYVATELLSPGWSR